MNGILKIDLDAIIYIYRLKELTTLAGILGIINHESLIINHELTTLKIKDRLVYLIYGLNQTIIYTRLINLKKKIK